MNILIVNQHTCNRGDEAAGRAVIESLLQTFPDAKIDVLYKWFGNFPPIDKDSEGVKHFTNIQYHWEKDKIYKLYIEIGLNMFLMLARSKYFVGKSGEICKKISDSDIVVNAPTGPNIGDIYKDKFYIITLIFAVLRGKKTFMYGSSVGPFKTNWLRHCAEFLFNRMNAVCVRDEISYEYLKELNLKNKNIYCSLDAAVQRVIDPYDADRLFEIAHIPITKTLVGITPLAYHWYPTEIRNESAQKQVETNIAYIINKLSNNDTAFVFFPQLFHLYGQTDTENEDLTIINSIINKLNYKQNTYIVPTDFDSDKQQKMISKLNYFIGMRYHSIVFSIKNLVPCIGICYEHKSTAFMRQANVAELSIILKEFIEKPDLVFDKINYIKNNSDRIRQKISDNLPELEKISAKGTLLIKKLLNI